MTDQKNMDVTMGELKARIIQEKSTGRFKALVSWLDPLLAQGTGHAPVFEAKLWNELGLAYLALDRPGRARAAYERAVSLAPDHVNALYNLGNLDLASGFYIAALDRFSKVLDLDPDHAGALYNSGLCHALEGRTENALPLFVRTTQMNPAYIGAFYWAGESYLNLGAYEPALEYFQKAAALDPDHPGSCRGLAICQLKTGAPDKALLTCQDLLMATGPEITALKVMGDAHLALGRVREAALCHLDMARLDLEASAFIVKRARSLFRENARAARAYAQRVIADLPELGPALSKAVDQEDPPMPGLITPSINPGAGEPAADSR